MAQNKQSGSDLPCRQTFAAAVELFLQLAKEQAKGGQVSVDALDMVAQVIESDPDVRKKYCDEQFEKCSQYVRLSMQQTPRVNVFGRIIAQPFENLLNGSPPVMATGQLANFFYTVEAILGRASYETYMERSLRLMERVSHEKGNEFTYNDLYSHQQCWEIRWDTYVALAEFFTKFELRKDWYKRMMQSDPDTPGQGIGPYPFSDYQFKAQMMCVFRAFTNLTDEELKRFEHRFKEKERENMSRFLAHVASIEDEA